ncbi:MAG: DUF2807 domain-containing protein [Tannerellaceae bacterium]|jgi:hypothetical protein|nr:DUF2807 domain-containing protein [Tannerellaceae bacterium]
MKKRILFFTTCLLMFTSTQSVIHAENIRGNGNLVTKEVAVSDFDKITIGSGIGCNNRFFSQKSYKNPVFNYKQATTSASLSITIDENLYPYLEVNNWGDELSVKTKGRVTINPSRFEINGTSKSLREISVSGCINFVTVAPFSSDNLDINVSGASDVLFNDATQIGEFNIRISGGGDLLAEKLICRKLESNVSGAGDITLTGKADKAKFTVSGAGDIKAFDFIVGDLECRVSGSGDARVNATETLDVTISGSGDVHYKGNAKVNTRVSGFGDIKKIND